MEEIVRNNRIVYKYEKHKMSDGVKFAILTFIISVIIFLLAIFISFLFRGEAPTFIAGFGYASILFDLCSLIFIVIDIYVYKNFHKEIRNMLILQLSFLIMWIFIV